MTADLIYDPGMAAYRFAGAHPMRPERFILAVDLIHAWGLVDDVRSPVEPATDDDLALVHDRSLIDAVRAAGGSGRTHPTFLADDVAGYGIGPGDTPAFPHMHEAAALVAGGTITALDAVLSGRAKRAFNPAGGMHHAHRDRVAGFCVYNDCAVAIARATALSPGLRVAYIDIDAHHGDGVEEAFYERADVLTISVHESGQYLYPGTGSDRQTGQSAGTGYALNAPMPPFAGDECYRMVLRGVIAPALRAFRPDIVVLQGGADTHRDDPLTHLDLSIAGYLETIAGLAALCDEVCEGRLVMTGGGGYEFRSAVPRMWAGAFALLAQGAAPDTVPASWLDRRRERLPQDRLPIEPSMVWEASEPGCGTPSEQAEQLTERTISELRRRHPMLAGSSL